MDIKNLAKSLMGFQSEVPPIPKNAKGYNYKYADLPDIIRIVTPVLKNNGLVFTQIIGNEGTNVNVKTLLIHVESGECLESNINHSLEGNQQKMNKIQAVGSIITYLRRYSLGAILGIVTDEDTDGNMDKAKSRVEQQQPQIQNISKEQTVIINNLISKNGADGKEFMKYLSKTYNRDIRALEYIRANEFHFVCDLLNKKGQQSQGVNNV